MNDIIYDRNHERNIDEMDALNKIYCEQCNHWVDRDEEWENDIDCCIYCAEEDSEYQSYIRKQSAEDAYWDMRCDEARGK